MELMCGHNIKLKLIKNSNQDVAFQLRLPKKGTFRLSRYS